MDPTADTAQRPSLDAPARLELLREEYRALYSLVLFRMTSLERRVPAVGTTMAGFLGGLTVLPAEAQHLFLVGLPLAILWFVRTTVNHARSFEDALRRVEEIERQANAIAGEDLLLFQSTHPSGGLRVGGRTGTETVLAVACAGLTLLAGCAYLAHAFAEIHEIILWSYWGYLGCVVMVIAWTLRGLVSYRYANRSERRPL